MSQFANLPMKKECKFYTILLISQFIDFLMILYVLLKILQ